jgi:hypothetical protein
MSINSTRRSLYRVARILGDVQAAKSGSPKKVAKRAANKVIGRKVVRRVWFR